MPPEDQERFPLSNKCWTCSKLFDVGYNKVRQHCRITGKYRGSAHQSCNINLKLIIKVSQTFHNLRGYDSHLTMSEIGKFNVNISVIPTGSEKYMAFTNDKNLVFIDRMQLMNSNLDTLVKTLSEDDCKYLSHTFSGNLLNQQEKGVYQ